MIEATTSPTKAALDSGQRATSATSVPSPDWETEFKPGIYEGYKALVEDRVSPRNGTAYTPFVFRVERADGVTGRFAYYIGEKRAEEARALKHRLALNPYAQVKLARKEGVSGMVVTEIPPDATTSAVANRIEAREEAWLA